MFENKILMVIGLVALGLLIGTSVVTYRTYDFSNRAIKVKGEVISVRSQYSGKGKTTVYKTVKFTPEGGKEVVVEVGGAGDAKKGDKLELLYDPENPETAYEDNFMAIWMLSFILFGSTLAFGIPWLINVLKDD